MTSPRRAALLLIGIVALSGCSGTETTPAAAPPLPTATTSVAADDCGGVADTVKQHLASTDVSTVVVNGQCTSVVVNTELADDDGATGNQLCESAGEVAYVDDINAVTVLSKAGTELAIGIPGQKCLP